MQPPERLAGDGIRAVLRPWRDGDTALLAAAAADPYIADVWALPAPGDRAGARAWIEAQRRRTAEGPGPSLAITAGDDIAAGNAGVTRREDGRASIYYWLAPDARGRGLAREAALLLGRWALEQPEIARLEAYVEPQNAASKALLEHLGFRREGLLRSFVTFGTTRRDVEVFSVLPGDAGSLRPASGGA
ncbi:MAG: GNAT family N-acetyltransferase [Solirubrobacteraceae bacterium]